MIDHDGAGSGCVLYNVAGCGCMLYIDNFMFISVILLQKEEDRPKFSDIVGLLKLNWTEAPTSRPPRRPRDP